MSLIGRLNDEDTKQAVLSKVEELPLDETITFVEARETGKTALKILGGNLSSGQVNKVQQEREDHSVPTVDRRAPNPRTLTLGKQTAQPLERNVQNVTRKDTMQGFAR
jgi:hypothetical protein